eukprot:446932_1
MVRSFVLCMWLTLFLIGDYVEVQSQSIAFQTIVNHTLPFSWSSGITFVYDQKLTLLGGSNLLNEMYTLDLSSIQLTDNDTAILPTSFNQNTWQRHSTTYPSLTSSDYSSLGITSYSQQWTVNGDRVYIAPLPNNQDLRDFLIFDMTQSQFLDPTSYESEGAAPSVAMSCVTNNYTHVFVLGGETEQWDQVNTNRIYNIQSDSWREGATMITARSYFGCEHNFVRDTLYIFGGRDKDGTEQKLDSIEKYQITSDQWTDLKPIVLSSIDMNLRCILDEVNHDYIFCIGGYKGGVEYLNTVDIFDTTYETVTTSNNALPFGINNHGVTFYNLNGKGIVFSIGGDDGSDLDMIQYTVVSPPAGPTSPPTMKPTLRTPAPTINTLQYQFTSFAPNVFSLPIAAQEHFAYIYDHKLNIFGGITTGKTRVLNTRYELDLNTIDFEAYFVDNVSSEINQTLLSTLNLNTEWTTIPLLFPTDRYPDTSYNYSQDGVVCTGTCSTIVASFMYIINGRSGRDWAENQFMIVYDMSSGSFVSKSTYNWTMPTDIWATCVTNDGLRIFVIGGYDAILTKNTVTKQIQIYTIASDSWALGREFSEARAFHSCAINSDKTDIFIFGGCDGDENFCNIRLDTIERYNIQNDDWTLLNATLSAPFQDMNGCILDSQYVDHILCIGGLEGSGFQYVRAMNIFNTDTYNVQTVSDSLAIPLGYSAPTMYNIPNSRRYLLFMFGGETDFEAYTSTSAIQYLAFIGPPPTDAPTLYPSALPTKYPSANPTSIPSNNPTANPTKQPSISPTSSPTDSTYNIYWIQTDLEEQTMIKPDYQDESIVAIESVVHEQHTSYSLTYVSTLVCKSSGEFGWQYITGVVEFEMDSVETLLSDETIKSDISNELSNIEDNIGHDIVLVNVEFSDDILTQCEGDEDLEALGDGESNFSSLGYYVLGFIVFLLVLLLIASYAMHSSKSFQGSDKPKYMALFRYCTNLGDFWSDIIFVLHLNAVGSTLFIWSLVFTLVPYSLSIVLLIAFIYIVKTSDADGMYVSIAKYLHKYDYILIGLSLIGGLFPSLSIVSSKLFHLEQLSMNLRYDHTARMQIIRFVNITFLENAPQLVIQVLFVGKRGLHDSITAISMFFSILSLLMGVIKTISTFLDQRTSNQQTTDVSRRIGDWLQTDSMFNVGDETAAVTVSNIQNNPNMVFDVKVCCSHFTKHHRFTQDLLTKLISEHIVMDETCLELFGFNMNSTHNELQFYVEISLTKLMRYEVDLNKVKFSKVKEKMLSLSEPHQQDDFVLKLMKKMKINTSAEEISITCSYKTSL